MKIVAFLCCLLVLSSCSPLGMATGAGASLGIASQTEGGIGGTANDIRIKIRISDLWFRYSIEAFGKLTLTVKDGRVLITGIVQNPDQRVEAVRLAWQVEGVRQVINEIRVAEGEGLPGYVRDQWITARLRTALTFDGGVYSINYSIETVQGNVYLMGIARTQEEMDRVVEIARTVPRVKQVISYITLAGQAMPPPPQQQPVLTGNAAQAAVTASTTTPAPAPPAPVPPVSGSRDSIVATPLPPP